MRKSKFSRYGIYLAVIFSILMAARGISRSLSSLMPDQIYGKDVLQEYLMSVNVLAGGDPYISLRSLAHQYLGVSLSADWRDETGIHPPPAVLMALPLGWLSYETAAALWWILEIICLIAVIVLAARSSGFQPSWSDIAIITGIVLGLPPFFLELYSGQLMIFILFLVTASKVAARNQHEWLTGGLLGVSVLLKFLTWPLVLAAVITRNWRTAISAVLVIVTAYGISLMVLGPEPVQTYLLKIIPMVDQDYRVEPTNFTVRALIWRFFAGTTTWGETAMSAPPAVDAPYLAAPSAAAMQFGILAFFCWIIRNQRNPAEWLALMLCVSILVSPLARDHYMVLTLLPASQIAYGLIRRSNSQFWLLLSICAGVALCIPHYRWIQIARVVAGLPAQPTEPFSLPFAAAYLTVLGPVSALSVLTYLCFRFGRMGTKVTQAP